MVETWVAINVADACCGWFLERDESLGTRCIRGGADGVVTGSCRWCGVMALPRTTCRFLSGPRTLTVPSVSGVSCGIRSLGGCNCRGFLPCNRRRCGGHTHVGMCGLPGVGMCRSGKMCSTTCLLFSRLWRAMKTYVALSFWISPVLSYVIRSISC